MTMNDLSVNKILNEILLWSKHPRISTNVERSDLTGGNSVIKQQSQ